MAKRLDITDEERKERKRESFRKWAAKNKDYFVRWSQNNRDKVNAAAARARSKPGSKEKRSALFKKWREGNLQRTKDNFARWYAENRERLAEKKKNLPREVRQAYARRSYEKVKDDPEFQLKNRARAKAGIKKRNTYLVKATPEERKKITQFIVSVRNRKRVKCYYCGVIKKGTEMQIDHVIPLARGGPHAVSNLCAACPSCNNHKNARMPQEFGMVLPL